MAWIQPLSLPEATEAARSILLAIPAMAFVSLMIVLRMTLFGANRGNASFLTVMKVQFMFRLKLWGILILAMLVILVLGFASNLASLAVTFPFWGAWTALLMLLSLWMAVRFMYLSREESGDYSILSAQRVDADEKWKRQDSGKRRVIQCFIGWILGVVIAMGWLMYLTDLTSLYVP
ncbi:MAG TPA: hypothetical protein VGG18_18115 [Granulicella sp.]|jgi:hypothetical protein